jgi:hypothetical protein
MDKPVGDNTLELLKDMGADPRLESSNYTKISLIAVKNSVRRYICEHLNEFITNAEYGSRMITWFPDENQFNSPDSFDVDTYMLYLPKVFTDILETCNSRMNRASYLDLTSFINGVENGIKTIDAAVTKTEIEAIISSSSNPISVGRQDI